jgi:DNA-binding Lrp family transcriptional regulator
MSCYSLAWDIITEFSCAVDCFDEREDIMVTALVLINVQRGTVNETAEHLLELDGVSEVYSVTGEYDLVAILRFQQYDDLANVVNDHMLKLTSIIKTHTLMGFKCFSRADLQQAWDLGVE